MIVFDKLVVITLCIIIKVNARPSVVPTGSVIVPSGITTVNDGRGISTTVVEGTPLVIAASPAVVASQAVVAAPAPISTTVIGTLGSNEIGESNTEGAASDDGSSSAESDESVGSPQNVDESSGSSSDEGVEATEPSVDESVQPTAVPAPVPAQPAEITANISPVPAPTVLAAPSTVIGTVPTTIASQSSSIVHSAAIVPGISPSQAVVTLAESPARSIAIQGEPLQILTVPRFLSVW